MMTISILVLYLLILLYIAFKSYSKIKSHTDFFVAQKRGSYWSVTGSLLATILGGSAVIGAIDAGSKMGWTTAWFMLSASIGLFALVPLSKKVSKIGKYTLPDLLNTMYGGSSKKIASVIIPIAWIGIIAAQIIASARILNSFTGLQYEIGVLVSGIVFIVYTIAGGQVSILKTDFIQSILIVLGIGVIGFFTHKYISTESITTRKFDFPFNSSFKPIDLIILLITYASTFTAGPDIYSRLFCAKNDKIAQKAVVSTAILLIPIAFTIGYLSVFGASLSGIESSGSSLIEITQLVLPTWLVPLVVLALLSAVLSSADTTLLSSSIIITDLLEKNKFGKKTLSKTRITILFVGIVSIVITLNFSSIIGMLLIALSVYSGAFILPILAGLIGFKIKSKYVSTGIIVGGIVALIGKLLAYSEFSEYSTAVIISAFALNGIVLILGSKNLNLNNK
ncbi:MAG: hypothetical protein PF541_03290 [Prolixibacteraceae bacterium]|jgi:SSS family solute:Na+ symporter|nr:hypothetical protein [Prolixibacteraceae bacterium]